MTDNRRVKIIIIMPNSQRSIFLTSTLNFFNADQWRITILSIIERVSQIIRIDVFRFEEHFIHLSDHVRQEFLASPSPSGVEIEIEVDDFEISDSEEDSDNINDELEQYIETNQAQESLEFFIIEEGGRAENMECAICIEKMEHGAQVCLTQCSHIFHSSCLRSWLRVNCVCPLCRQLI